MTAVRRLVLLTTAVVLLHQPPLLAAAPASAPNGVRGYSAPPANARFDYQLGGAYRPARSVRVVDRDRTSHPAAGRYNLCYVNGFQTQDYQAEWWQTHHPDLLLHDESGELVEDPNWPGEYLLDTSTAAKRHALLAVIGHWIDICATKGFDGTEPDNLDSNTRSQHLLTAADNLAFAALLAARAHRDGLAIGQKNDAELSARARRTAHFDFAIAESCQVYRECGYYRKTYGDEVFEVEYGAGSFHAACHARGKRISIIRRDRNLVARGKPGYTYRSC
ncbi:MAG TPA: endo alpha-1,4 polygalactosaminidase [Mycobacteriales bacterium]|nr:endo alpha-1,4 polygalactosaminidase [Mycobacteriales bacterium]